jgi:hypothetical protein
MHSLLRLSFFPGLSLKLVPNQQPDRRLATSQNALPLTAFRTLYITLLHSYRPCVKVHSERHALATLPLGKGK